MLAFSLGVVFLFVGIMFIWPVIIQDGFNKVGEGEGQPPVSPESAPQSPAATPAPLPPTATDTPVPPTSPSRDA
jgi:hypothetical protein